MAIEDLSHVFIGDPTEVTIRPGEVMEVNPIREGLVLWYDFYGRSNLDADRLIVNDMSGAGNRGVLQNFAYTEGSGFVQKGLHFDGVDDYIIGGGNIPYADTLDSFCVDISIARFRQNPEDDGGIFALLKTYYSNRFNLGYKDGKFYISTYNPEISWQGVSISADSCRFMLTMNTVIHERDSRGYVTDMTMQMYADGVYVGDMRAGTYKYSNVGREFYVGWQATNSSSPTEAYLQGAIGGVRMYSRALDINEIAHNYAMERERYR